jgi:phosphoribosylformimino-5-aminoimidazole carboxamide ribonucleotide (ProFAR) isomerase
MPRELANVDALAGQSRLEGISFGGCERLADLEAVRNLRMLEFLWLRDCKGLRNVAGLSGFKGLRDVDLTGCTGLTRESIDALKAALPDAKIAGP